MNKLSLNYWQAKRVSNPQPSVLETDTLPIELLAYLTSNAYAINLSNQIILSDDLSYHTSTNSTATFTNGEA